jgi:hypothetical protein
MKSKKSGERSKIFQHCVLLSVMAVKIKSVAMVADLCTGGTRERQG